MIGIAYAMGQGGAAGQGDGLSAMIPLVLMFGIFYFLLIRPQQKKAKEHQQMVDSLKNGDRIITSGGIYGTITAVNEGIITLEIADRVRIKVMRGNIATQDAPPVKKKEKKKKENSN